MNTMVEVESPTATTSGRESSLEDASGGFAIDRQCDHSACVRWSIPQFSKLAQKATRCLFSKYFDVGGYDCRLLVYPAGDSQAVRGYVSIYVQVTDPKNAPKWDCFASHKLSVVHQTDEARSICRDSWHRFSAKKKSHGWCEFAPVSSLLDPRQGLSVNDTVVVTAEVSVLSETVTFSRDAEMSPTSVLSVGSTDVMNGKFTWKVHNFGLFRDMIKSQKIMSPAFPAGDCNLRLSIYQSVVQGTNYLSMCLESKDPDKASSPDRSCWCLFRMSVLSQTQGTGGGKHLHRDSFGRFAADIKTGDNTSLGWNDFMSMASFTDSANGHLVDDSATFSATFYVIRESSTFSRNVDRPGAAALRPRSKHKAGSSTDLYQGRFTWKIEHFTRLKELLKKRKITGMCVKSKRFQVAGRDCRLIIYPRGQSQPPNHLSMFLEVTESAASSWSCFVSHRLSVQNQQDESKSVTKESQNRYSKQAKDWGWREFLTLTSLFDQDAGFLVNDAVTFAAEVLVLKESYKIVEAPGQSMAPAVLSQNLPRLSVTWHIDNFSAFKDILETRKLFSKYFCVDGSELRIGVYESSNTLCMYLESDTGGSTLENNLWVKFRIAVLNQKHPEKSEWRESAICTKTWNNSVLQFGKAPELVGDGTIFKDSVMLCCEILECCPWFEFADLDLGASDADFDTSSSISYEIADSDAESESGIEEAFSGLLGRVGVSLKVGQGPGPLHAGVDLEELDSILRERLLVDAGAVATFASGLRTFLNEPLKVQVNLTGQPHMIMLMQLRRLLLPTMGSKAPDGPCLLDLLVGIPVLQQPLLVLVLDTLISCCTRASDGQLSAPTAPGAGSRKSPLPAHATAAADRHLHSPLSRHEPSDCASSTSPAQDAPISAPPPAFARSSRHREAGAALHEAATHRSSGKGKQGPLLVGEAGRHLPNGLLQAARAEDVLLLGMQWLQTLPKGICQNVNGKACHPDGLQAPLAQKLLMLAAVVPRRLQTQAVLLVPHLLLAPSEQTRSADALLHCLRTNVWGDAFQDLRVPVFAALNIMDLSTTSACDVADMLLEVLPSLADTELPQAVALGAKAQGSAVPGWAAKFAKALRMRVHASAGQPAGSAALDSARLGLVLDTAGSLASAVLSSIGSEWRASKPAAAVSEDARETDAVTPAIDLEFLLDALSQPSHRKEAEKLFSQGVANGWVNEHHVLAALLRRRTRLAPPPLSATPAVAPPHPTDVASIPMLAANSLSSPSPVNDFDCVLSLAADMADSSTAAVSSMAAGLYRILLRCFTEPGHRDAVLSTLVQRACTGTEAAEADEGSPRSSSGAGILLDVLQPYPDCFAPALQMLLATTQTAVVQAEGAEAQVQGAKAARDRAQQDQQAAVQRSRSEVSTVQRLLDESRASLADAQGSHRSALAAANSGRKELQDKLGNLERELEWVRGELEEERAAAARKGKDAAGRAREADTAVARLKSLHKEEAKRLGKEKHQLAERVQELEAAQSRSTGALAAARSSAAAAAQQQETAVRHAEDRVSAAQAEVQALKQQVEQYRARADESAAAAQASSARAESAEQQLRKEQARVAPLYGAHLDQLTPADLAALATVHEDGLRRIKALQAQKARPLQEEEDDENGELAGSLPSGVDLSFMNGHDPRNDPLRPPLSRASVTSSAESLASISSGPANGLQQHSYAAGRPVPHQPHHTSLGSNADFSGFGAVPGPGMLPRRHSMSQEHARNSGAFPPNPSSQPLRGQHSAEAYSSLAGGLMTHRGLPAAAAVPRHLGGISQALGISMSAPFALPDAGRVQMGRGGTVVGRPQMNGPMEATQRFQARPNQLGSLQQKAVSRGASAAVVPPHQQQQPGRAGAVGNPGALSGIDRARSPAVGPFFAANGHSAAFAPADPALSGAFPASLLNGLGRSSGPSRDGSGHQLW